jgi:hypothetical protein
MISDLRKGREGTGAKADQLFAHQLNLASLSFSKVQKLSVRHHHVHLGNLLYGW